MIPEWVTHGVPAICKVDKIYISTEPKIQTYIAECANKNLYALHLDPEPLNIKLSKINKIILWQQR